MGFSLYSFGEKHRSFHLTWDEWGRLFELACQYGWEPCGTRLDSEVWEGIYFSNDGQIVIAEDAGRLAGALEKALDDIPDHDAARPKLQTFAEKLAALGYPPESIAELTPSTANMLVVREGESLNTLEYYSYKGKRRVTDFIAFCREGAFSIW